MKHLKLFLVLTCGFLVSLVAATVFYDHPASAAAAACYKADGNPLQATSISCDELIGLPAPPPQAGPIGGSFFQDDICYFLAWGIVTSPAGSSDCQQWEQEAQSASSESDSDSGGGSGGGSSSGGSGSAPDESVFEKDRDEIVTCDATSGQDCLNENPVVVLAKLVINILGALVAIVVVGVIVFAGIQYSSSGGEPAKTATAKKRIINAIIALVAYLFLYVALQWLIPGGLFA